MHEPVDAPLGDRREVRQRDREEVERHRDRLAVEVSAAQQLAVLEDQRIVGRRVELAADRCRRRSRARRAPGPCTCGMQRSAVRVLHARIAVAVRFADLAVGEQLAQQRRRLAPGRAARARRGCARRTRPACPAAPRATSRRRRAPCARARARRRRASAAIAVCACVPLMSVMPFLRTERRPARARARASIVAAAPPRVAACSSVAFADQREREMRERREIAARADASLLRDRRIQPGVQHREQQLGELGTRAGVALRDARSRAAASSRAPRARAAAARRRRRGCARGSPAARRAGRGGIATSDSLPKPVVTPYATAPRLDERVDDRVARCIHARARRRRELHRRTLARHATTSSSVSDLPSSDHGASSCAQCRAARRDNSRRASAATRLSAARAPALPVASALS